MEFKTGRPLEFGKTRYSGDFSVRGFDVHDLDGDGREEIVALSGQMYRLDPSDIRGCSPQFEEKYAWKDMEPGSQLIYIRIPRSDAELADYFPLDSVSRIINYGNGQFSAWSDRSGLEYVFDRSLNVVEVRGSHHFQFLHENSRKAGKISSVADAAYFERIRRSVLYWDGSSWSALAAPSR